MSEWVVEVKANEWDRDWLKQMNDWFDNFNDSYFLSTFFKDFSFIFTCSISLLLINSISFALLSFHLSIIYLTFILFVFWFNCLYL